MLRDISASPDISAYARYYAPLILLVAENLRPKLTINYARRANNGRRPNYAAGKLL